MSEGTWKEWEQPAPLYHVKWVTGTGYVVRRGEEQLDIATFVFSAHALLFAAHLNLLVAMHGTDAVPIREARS